MLVKRDTGKYAKHESNMVIARQLPSPRGKSHLRLMSATNPDKESRRTNPNKESRRTNPDKDSRRPNLHTLNIMLAMTHAEYPCVLALSPHIPTFPTTRNLRSASYARTE